MHCKIKRITFEGHPILRNLALDFTDKTGRAVDTVIFAGENGTCKSTIINAIYEIVTGKVNYNLILELEYEGVDYTLNYKKLPENTVWVTDNTGLNTSQSFTNFKQKYSFKAIFSDVDINFNSADISSVTSLSLDTAKESLRSNIGLPKLIKQLIVDIHALDDAATAKAVKANPSSSYESLKIETRMPRFTNAFNYMFDDLEYDGIENIDGKKVILFKKGNELIPIDNLSSGEKQIVYRGCFMLKDIDALNGAFAFIDEPEISLHPNWQKKILDFYKMIFSDAVGNQTSQLFVVTHSPFIIHNENRRNDKVLVLKRSADGNVHVLDDAKYYICESLAAVKDAFSINDFADDIATVYLEGKTDEKYFNKALEVFGYDHVAISFRQVGYTDSQGKEFGNGADSLKQVYRFLCGQDLKVHHVCLLDCDVKSDDSDHGRVHSRRIQYFASSCGMEMGIENALNFEGINLERFYIPKVKFSGYNEKNEFSKFDKVACCEYICGLDNEKLKTVFRNLKGVIEEMISLCELQIPEQ